MRRRLTQNLRESKAPPRGRASAPTLNVAENSNRRSEFEDLLALSTSIFSLETCLFISVPSAASAIARSAFSLDLIPTIFLS